MTEKNEINEADPPKQSSAFVLDRDSCCFCLITSEQSTSVDKVMLKPTAKRDLADTAWLDK